MGVKKFRSIFMRYVLFLVLGLVVIFAINLGLYLVSINTGMILPLPQVQETVETAQAKLQSSEKMDVADIPAFCEFAFFSNDGIFQGGSVDSNKANEWWTDCVDKQNTQVPHPPTLKLTYSLNFSSILISFIS